MRIQPHLFMWSASSVESSADTCGKKLQRVALALDLALCDYRLSFMGICYHQQETKIWFSNFEVSESPAGLRHYEENYWCVTTTLLGQKQMNVIRDRNQLVSFVMGGGWNLVNSGRSYFLVTFKQINFDFGLSLGNSKFPARSFLLIPRKWHYPFLWSLCPAFLKIVSFSTGLRGRRSRVQ